ncbi:MAG TPA: hypothetical protein VFF31_10415, partial [Blastocatellia bacterium]|nr:hypothetical protein [Blastocatellia bacterium]
MILLLIAAMIGFLPRGGESQTLAKAVSSKSIPDGGSARDIRFYSEGIQCHARLFTPKGFGAESKAPAIVLAPGWGETSTSIEKYAAYFASRGLVAMTID